MVGFAGLAYTFGLRHAFDADHIAAIDNTTRKLMDDDVQAARRRVLLFARSLDGGARDDAGDRVRRAMGERANCPSSRASSAVYGRNDGVRRLPVRDRHRQPAGADRRVPRVQGDRAAASTTPRQLEARLSQRGWMTRWFGGLFRCRDAVRGTCTGSACCSGWGSTRRPKSALLTTAGVAASQALPLSARCSPCPIVFAAGMCLDGQRRRRHDVRRVRLGVRRILCVSCSTTSPITGLSVDRRALRRHRSSSCRS